jgi:hypothetical protein
MITDNRRTQISEPSSNKTEKRNSSKDKTVSEKSLDELESIQMEDEMKNILVTIFSLVINSRDAKGGGTPRKLATATQPQFPRIVIRLS